MTTYLLLAAALSGTVVDEKNLPVEGAAVVVMSGSYREEPSTGTSDAMGRFSVALPKGGPFRVEAYAPGYVPFRARDVDPEKPLSIVLRQGGEVLSGAVRDGTTLDPLKGAVVETRSGEAGGRVWAAPRLGIVDAVTDGRGEFRLEGLPKGSYSVTASASGYGRSTKLNASPGEPVELYLFPGSGIYGRLLDEKGIPVEGAIVFVESRDRMSRTFGGLPIDESDADGRFALLGLDPGRYRLFARKEGSAPAVHDLELTKERDTEVELVLTVGVTLRGRLVDVDDEPVKGRVSLSALDGGEVGAFLRSSFTAETDAEGVFSLLSVPAGDHTLVAEGRGYGATNVDASVSGKNKEDDLGDVVLETGLAISGRVMSASGSPIAGANVYALPSFRPGMAAVRDRTFEAETDEEGRFILAGLSEGTYNVHVGAAGFAHSNPAIAATGQTNVTITLNPAGSIRGTAVDPEGHPVASLRAEARSPDERGFSQIGGAEEGGVFVVETVPEGEYAVQITAPDFLPAVVSSVRVTAGSVTELGTVRLRRGGRIEGTVVNASDEAVPGATVRALSPERSPYIVGGEEAVSTDRLGRFRIGGLADGVVQVVASHPGYAETRLEKVSIDSSSGASEVGIVLRRGGAVEGYVRGREAADVAGRRIQASFEGGARRPWDAPSAETSEDGYFRIDHLPPGKVTVALVQVEPNSMYAIQSREVEVREDETTYVEFHSRRILVQGQVRRGGAPLSGAAIAFDPATFSRGMLVSFGRQGPPPSPTGPRYLAAVASDDGYYELLVDEPGEYRISASASGVGLPSKTVTVPDVESFSLDLDYGGATVSGRVVDKETESPIAGAFVSARSSKPSAGGSGSSIQAGPFGGFELQLDPGEVTLTVQAEGYGSAERKVALEEGGRADVVLALSRGLRIAGRVVDANGRGMANLRILAVEDSPDVSTPSARFGFAISLPDGAFRMDDLTPGRYNLLASGAAGFAFLPSVPSGTEDLDLALRPGGRVEVLVVDSERAPVPNALVALAAIDGKKVRGSQGAVDAGGRIELLVPRGNVTLKAAVMNGPEGLATVAVSENATARVEIVVAPIVTK